MAHDGEKYPMTGGQDAPGSTPYGQPGQPPYGQPGLPPYGQPGQPPYGKPGQPPYGQPGQPPYGQPCQPQYGPPAGQPAYGNPGYGQPQQGYPPPAYGQPQYGGQQVIVTQPGGAPGAVYVQPRPTNYMIPSILACLFCFCPTGLCAIYYAHKANQSADDGDLPHSNQLARSARNLIIASVVVFMCWLALVVVLRFLGYFSYYRY
ncbi:PRT1B-like protein [Mya arenaria]|uniref:PRT1B-like protein n=1 Tax=Mya arenaria TaxID=6604 RepID=A0ABY7DSQ6_MYAAR|nr:calcium-binding protein P-like [Mya arenaria]WAQ99385.1 PRT1B-like protein [Mya arenaria]